MHSMLISPGGVHAEAVCATHDLAHQGIACRGLWAVPGLSHWVGCMQRMVCSACLCVSWVVCMQSLTPAEVRAEKRALVLRKAAEEEKRKSDLWASVRRLLKSPSFQVGRTLTCALPMAA